MRIFFYPLLIALLSLNTALHAQFYAEPFTADLGGWGNPPLGFEFAANGEANAFADWNTRSRIRSASLGGAMVFTGPGAVARTTSPAILLPGPVDGDLYLSFYTYFSSAGGAPRVFIQGDNGLSVDTILQLGLEAGEETSAGDYHLLALGGQLGDAATLTIQFDLVGGAANFWIIDDVELSRTLPDPVTFPRYFGETLTQAGLPFIVDDNSAPAVPFQLVVDWLPGITERDRQDFRDMYSPVVLHTCACDRLEVWEMAGGVFFDPVSGQPLGDPTDILNVTLPASGMNKVDGLDLNYYSYNDLQVTVDVPNVPLTADEVNAFPPAPASAVKVAVLDTGLDLDHPALAGFVYRTNDALDGVDDNGDCLTDNPLGWNYVDANNNPDDDNGHGTHVAGIIAQSVADCADCVTQLVPYKTHDTHGVGTLFASACAVLQASVYDGAAVLNCSWGFYGGGDEGILKSAIDTAGSHGALVIAAAGNDSLNLDYDPQFPALYSLGNILAIGAHDTLPAGESPLAPFSNFSNVEVDLAAFGVEVNSLLPGGGSGIKSGTSMAAPAVAAAAALFNCAYPAARNEAGTFLVGNALSAPELLDFVSGGNRLNLAVLCPIANVDQRIDPTTPASIQLDPVTYQLTIKALQPLGKTTITIRHDRTGVITAREVENFTTGTTLNFALSTAPAGDLLIILEAVGSVYTQRLVKR